MSSEYLASDQRVRMCNVHDSVRFQLLMFFFFSLVTDSFQCTNTHTDARTENKPHFSSKTAAQIENIVVGLDGTDSTFETHIKNSFDRVFRRRIEHATIEMAVVYLPRNVFRADSSWRSGWHCRQYI